MSDPLIEHDFELHFLNGAKDYITAQEGRDHIEVTTERVYLIVQHQDGVQETIDVPRASLASLRSARRVVNTDAEQVHKLEAGELAQA